MKRQRNRKQHAAVTAIATAAILCLALAPAAVAQEVAQVRTASAGIDFQPLVEHGGLVLTVSGPDGFHHRAEFGAGESPSFSIFDHAGGALPDGSYKYELRVTPTHVQRREVVEANRLESRAARQGIEPLVQSGSFVVIQGAVLAGGEAEPEAGPAGGNRLATKDQVIPDDLIVQGSICAGFDCVNGESFGFDTIRMKENNTRIKFEDTSSTTGFPSTDWQLTANDSASGGLNKFSIEDITAARVPFTIEGGSTTNSIYVDSTGRVGFRTSTPVLDIHVATSNTPGMRLEQTNAGGFTAQTWDVAGNEANFFVRDVTSGSRLPFRIRPGAPTSSIDISASGNVGLGTASPTRALHVIDTGAVDNTVIEFQNDGPARMRINNSANGEIWNFGHQSPGGSGLVFSDVGDADSEMLLDVAGNLTITGSLTVGPGGCTGCDLVFSPGYPIESIEEHARYMWENSHLPGVGPTPEDAPMNLSKKTGGILNELEKAHIYIEQLNGELKSKQQKLAEIESTNRELEQGQTELQRQMAELRAQLDRLLEPSAE